MIQQLGYNNPGQDTGVVGIANGQGDYVCYPDYTTAMAAAKAGDTIVQFADIVEYRQITIILKNGVNINMNGFTYELKATTDIAAFQDRLTAGGSGGVTMSLMNGTIKCTPRQAFALGAANPMCLQLLFSSGSTVVETEGKKALIDLAKVLETEKEVEIVVEGHTDTDKFTSSASPRNNWELSVLRSTAVVEIMTANSKMNPVQLMAAGRSEYIPVDVKDKAKNRRIEIIISPNLNELFEIISK